MKLIWLVFALGSLFGLVQSIFTVNPVIFIPGDGGSQLYASLNKTSVVHYLCEKTSEYFNVWLNIELLVPLIIDCWIDNVKLIYDNKTRTTRNNDGVTIDVPGFGSSETVEWIDPSHASAGAYFKDIANVLVAHGDYVRNISIRGAPYDFRKAPNENGEFFVKLKDLVEQTYTLNGNQSIIFLTHSMGSLMALHFLHGQTQAWKDKYIRTWISLAGVWGGSIKAIKVYAIGDDLGSFMLRQKILREEQITSPSLAWLLPSPLFWKDDEVFVETPSKNYTLRDYKDFLYELDLPYAWEMRKDVEKYTLNFTPPGVELHCLHGITVPTVEKLFYKTKSTLNGSPVIINGDGDGTVNLRSLSGCKLWDGYQKQRIYYQTFPKVDHMTILKHKDVLDYISHVITKVSNNN